MVRRHPEVCQQSVDVVDTVVAHPVFQIAEVAAYECELLVRVAYVAFGIGILVETVQMRAFGQPAQYLARVSAAAERHVDVYATGLDVEPAHALVEQNRYMVALRSCYGLYIFGSICVHYHMRIWGVKLHKNPRMSLHLGVIFIK